MAQYPSQFVLPDYGNYIGSLNMGQIRTSMPTSNASQIEGFNSARIEISMTFSMTVDDYEAWTAWVIEFAYDWFDMPVISPHMPNYITSDSRIRFISDTALQKRGHDWISVAVTGELIQGDESLNPATATYPNWILAGTPASPSADDIDPGTPAAPSTNMIVSDLYGYEI